MMSLIIATTVVTLIPGPSLILIMLNSIQRGLMQGVQTAFGAVLADALLLTFIMSGMGTLLYTSPLLFAMVKWGGVLYLIYLGVKQVRSPVEDQVNEAQSNQNSFLQGLGITLLNPKIIGFFIAFFPQFLKQDAPIVHQLLVLGPVFLLTVLVLFLLVALFARSMSKLMESYNGRLLLKNSAGVALVGCGLFAATVDRTHAVTSTHENHRKLVYCSEGNPEAFNPQITLSGTSSIATGPTIYDRLTAFEYGTTKIIPGLAERWTLSADKKVYTFYLRKNVEFQTTDYFKPTRVLNADDVLFSLNRQLQKDHPYHSVNGGIYQYFQGMGLNSLIQKVVKLDQHTVQIVLNRPETPFLANLAMPFMSILSQEYAEQLTLQNKQADMDHFPIGTGPFAFKKFVRGSMIRYVAHPTYWQGAPQLDELIFAITPDATVRYQKLRKGECHVAVYPSPADIPEIEANPDLQLEKIEGLNIGYLALNTEKPPFDNVLVRRAIAHSLNKQQYIRAIYLNHASPAKNPFPSTLTAFNESVTEYEYNPKKAKALLTQAGFSQGFKTTLWTLPIARPFNPNGKKLGEMMQSDLAAVGIQAELQTFDWSTYLEKAKAGDQEMMQLGWTGDNGDADNFLTPLFSCDSVTRGSNNSRFCHKEFDSLVSSARMEARPAERIALYKKAQLIFKEQEPVVPLVHTTVFRARSLQVKNYRMDPFDQERFFMLSLD